MDSKLKKYCVLCNASKYGKIRNHDDTIQRTTDCRLSTESGSVLKIHEVHSSVDEEAMWNKRSCQCVPNASHLSSNKKLIKAKAKKEERVNCYKEHFDFKPKWFFQFTTKQFVLLERLVLELIDDSDEGTDHRVQLALFHLGLYPLPSLNAIQKAKQYNTTNAVLFLNDLLLNFNKSESRRTFGHNQRLLMSGIFYLELPYLLKTLLNRLRMMNHNGFVWKQIEPKIGKFVSKEYFNNSINSSSPYKQPIWPRNLQNWQDQRKKDLEIRSNFCKFKQQIVCPDDAFKDIKNLTHISSSISVPALDIISEHNSSEKENFEGECLVVKFLRELKPQKKTCIDTNHQIQRDSRDEHAGKYFLTVFEMTLKDLENQGMISAAYPHLQHHPILIHLQKFLKREVITKQLKKSLAEKAAIREHCIKMFYLNPKIENLNERLPDKTWAEFKSLKKASRKNRNKILNFLWKQRVQCGQNLWQTLSPEYPQGRSFLPVFSAYATSYKTTVNLWGALPREL